MTFLSNNFHLQNKQIAALFLGASATAGVIYFALFLAPFSGLDYQAVMELSTYTVLLGTFFGGLLLVNLGALLFTILNLGYRQKVLQKNIASFFARHSIAIVLALYAVLILAGAFLLLVLPPIIRPLKFLEWYNVRLGDFLSWIFFADLLIIAMIRVITAETWCNNSALAQLDLILACAFLFLVTFVSYAHIAALIGWINKSNYSFWDLLSGQFLQGKLYLENPPYTHDLTLYKGKWYVPMPPIPALLMVPIAYWIGAENISTSYLSMIFSAINGVLVYLILKQLAQRKWIELSKNGIFWLIVIFLFGTPHLWVGISGRGWFVSQILTVLFLALAIYASLRFWSSWIIATCLGLAIMTRPNSLMTWPLVFAISMQIIKENQGSIELKQVFQWIIKTTFPITLAVIGLLTYNYLRFENFLDFGYVNINGDPDIVTNVKTYGIFSPHFILPNLEVMFFKMPRINWGAPWPVNLKGDLWPIDPRTTGMSMFITTPPLLYLFRRYQKKWWIIGAWLAILLNLVMLSCYSNTGAAQFGYRYILDFLVPLIMLLAVGVGKKNPWPFIILALASIVINIYGAYWFMNG